MCWADIYKKLVGEGYTICRQRIYGAIEADHVDRPQKNGSGHFVFLAKHARQIRRYLDNPPKPRPKQKKPELE